MPLQPGTSLGPYQIQAPLGAGGMGEVYKATDTRLDRTVAIKVLPEHVASDPDTKQRFEREARAVAALNHPHICTLHDIGSQDGVDFLVMEHLDGQTLRDRLAERPFTVTEAVQHGLTLLATLEAVHRQHLVHRDLKPANVFLTPNGLKLLDFGLAVTRRAEADATALDLTQPGTVLGTPRYMAPETLRGRAADERSDLFAVGALLYEMIAGSPAFGGESAVDVLQAVISSHPPMLTGSSAALAADRVIHRALEKRPEDRYQTASAMASDLRGVLATSDVANAPIGRQARRVIVLPFRMLRPDPRRRVSELQPTRCHYDLVVRASVARRAIDARGWGVCHGETGPQTIGHGSRGRSRPRRDRYCAAVSACR